MDIIEDCDENLKRSGLVRSIDVTTQVTVAEWLKHLPATLEVTGSRPTFGDISEIYFLESIQSTTRWDLKWSLWHCGN